jgi:hypothetical protein
MAKNQCYGPIPVVFRTFEGLFRGLLLSIYETRYDYDYRGRVCVTSKNLLHTPRGKVLTLPLDRIFPREYVKFFPTRIEFADSIPSWRELAPHMFPVNHD